MSGHASVPALMAATEHWAGSPLGPPAGWPASLKTVMGLIVPAAAQIVLFWGPDYVALYNDAYAPTIGDKHPHALGRPAREHWAELWDDLEPLLRSVRESGETLEAKDRPFYIERHGYGEDVFFDISFSAVPDESGDIGGVLCIVAETTQRVLAEQRQSFVLALSDATRPLADPDEVVATTARLLGERLGAARVVYADIDETAGTARVYNGWTNGDVAQLPGSLRLTDFGAPLIDWLKSGRTLVVSDIDEHPVTRGEPEGLRAIAAHAIISVPLIKNGRLVANLNVHDATPRLWSDSEVRLVEQTAERTWDTVERARAEATKRAGQRELSHLADTLPVLISYMDSDRRYRFVNQAYERWFPSRRREDMIGMPVHDVIGDAAYAAVKPWMDEAMDGKTVSFVQAMPYAEGGDRHVHVDYVPRFDHGKVAGVYALINDITDAKRVEAQLRESEERFRNMADHAPVIMWVTDATGYCTYLNKAWYEFTGQSPAEAEGFGWLDATHPGDKAEAESVFAQANEAGRPFRVEYRLRRSDGSYRWAIDAAAPRFAPDGSFLGFVGSVIDIDERREAEQKVRANEERLRLASEAADLGFWDVDMVRDELIWPPSVKAMFGISAHVPVTMADFYQGLHLDDQQATICAFEAACDPDQRALYDIEYRTIGREDGVVRWVAAKGRAIFDEAGRCLRVVGTAIDVTERKIAERALQASEARLRFLAELDEALRKVRDPSDAMAAATRLLVQQLDVSRCAYADVDSDNDRFFIRADFNAPGVPTSVGEYRLELFGPRASADMRRGRTLVVRDVTAELAPGEGREMFQAIGIDAIICCPLVKEGGLRAMMAVHNAEARDWTLDEIEMVETVVERCWAQIERVGAEARLRESEERYRTLFTSIESGFCVVEVDPNTADGRADYRVVEANPAFYRQTGFPDDILGRWLREAAPLLEEHWYERYARIASTGESERFEDGSIALGRWFDVYAFRVGEPEDRRVAILFSDISVRRSVEMQLRDSEAKFHAIANSIDQMVWSTRPDGFHDYFNDRWYEFTGVPVGTTDGQGWENVFHPDDQARANELWRHSLATGEPYHIEYRLRHRSGSYRWVIGRAQCAYDEQGRISRWFGTCTDIHDLKEAEERLRDLNDTLEERVVERTADLEMAHEALRQSQKMEAMGQLTGGVAHDFNNLLTPIVGTLDLLQRKQIGGDREQRLIAGAAQSAERAKTLVQRLLAFARRQPLQMVAVDVVQLVDGMADLIASTTGPQIKVVVNVAEHLPSARADPNQLEMALLNLAVNARDAMPEGGTLRISAEPARALAGTVPGLFPGDYVRLSVADTGIGMNEDTIARAIEPFFSTKGVGQGTGLGLSMVHGLASQLGGALNISSKPGLGTNIELWLPQTEAAPAAPESSRDTVGEARRGTVLLVDDEELVRMSTADMLEDMGFRVIEASSSEEALQVLGEVPDLDLLVTDHLMPGMTGSDLARRVRLDRGDLPVLVISGYAEGEGVAPDLPRLTKPFRADELATSLDAVLQGTT